MKMLAQHKKTLEMWVGGGRGVTMGGVMIRLLREVRGESRGGGAETGLGGGRVGRRASTKCHVYKGEERRGGGGEAK